MPPPTSSDALRTADTAAQRFAPSPPEEAEMPCPLKEREALEIVVVGDDDQPVEDVLVVVRNGENEITSRTGVDGIARFDGLLYTSYGVCLPEIDGPLWEFVKSTELKPPFDESAGDAQWQSPKDRGTGETTHEVRPGDCVSSIAFLFGRSPKKLWEHARNKPVRDRRGDPNTLQEDLDAIYIPPLERKMLMLSARHLHCLRRRGALEALRVRFLSVEGQPRKAADYILRIQTMRETVEPDRSGKLDEDGVLIEFIPPDAIRAEVALPQSEDLYELALGHSHPVSTDRGLRDRLNALGYYRVGPDIEDGPLLSLAIRDFQNDAGLKPTGVVDIATLQKLESRYMGETHEVLSLLGNNPR